MVEWTGFLRIVLAGTYKFRLGSDDGSVLYIDGRVVANNAGRHSHRFVYGSVYLEPGLHPIYTCMFEWTGRASFGLDMYYWSSSSTYLNNYVDVDEGFVFHSVLDTNRVVLAAPGRGARLQTDVRAFNAISAPDVSPGAPLWPRHAITVVASFRTTDSDIGGSALLSYTGYGPGGIEVATDDEVDGGLELLLFRGPAGNLQVFLFGVAIDTPATANDGGWHTFAVAYRANSSVPGAMPRPGDGDGRHLRVWMDGGLVYNGPGPRFSDEQTEEAWEGPGPSFSDQGCLMFGQAPRAIEVAGGAARDYICGDSLVDSYSLEGDVGPASVWGRELTNSEISQLVSSGGDVAAIGGGPNGIGGLVLGYGGRGDNITIADARNEGILRRFLDNDASDFDDDNNGQLVYEDDVIAWRDASSGGRHAAIVSDEGARPVFLRNGVFPNSEPDSGALAGWWTFGPEAVGTASGSITVADRSGNGNTAVVVTSGLSGSGPRFGSATDAGRTSVFEACWDSHLRVDGLANYDWEGGDSQLGRGEGFAVSVFFRRLRSTRQQSLVGNGFGVSSSWEVRMSPENGGNNVGAVINFNAGTFPRGFTGAADVGEWHHAIMSYDGALDQATWLVDGEQVTINGGGAVPQLNKPLLIGASATDGRDRFCGQIHDVRIYDRPVGRQEARGIWAGMSHNVLFGDGLHADCAVGPWSGWSACSSEGTSAFASDIASVQSRTRAVTSGSVGCPSLVEVRECGPGLVISPTPLTLSGIAPKVVHVHLATMPRHLGNVLVTVDSSLASGALAVSTCSLTFNHTSWNISQPVIITPRLSEFSTGEQTFAIAFRAFNYTRTFELSNGVAATGNFSVVIDPQSGLPIQDQGAYTLAFSDEEEAIEQTLAVTIHHLSRARCKSWGDPHFTRFDRQTKYNLFTTGDFYMARSCDGEFVVQTRQEPCFRVSCNTAVVIKFRESVAAFDLRNRHSIDPISILSPTWNDGVRIHRLGCSRGRPSYRFTMPNGASVVVSGRPWRNTHFLNIDINVPPLYQGILGGLCGSFDGNAANDWIGADGQLYGRSRQSTHNYGMTFAIPPNSPENLFTYGGSAVIPVVGGQPHTNDVFDTIANTGVFFQCHRRIHTKLKLKPNHIVNKHTEPQSNRNPNAKLQPEPPANTHWHADTEPFSHANADTNQLANANSNNIAF